MGMQEKEREDEYWAQFAQTGQFPELPQEFADPRQEEYVRSVLRAPYNQLTKILFGEILARAGRLTEDDSKAVAEAADWLPRIIFSKKRNYPRCRDMGDSFAKFRSVAVCCALKSIVNEAWQWVKKAGAIYKGLPQTSSSIGTLIQDFRRMVKLGSWDAIRADARLRSSILFWLVKLMAKGGGGANVAGMTFVKIFKYDGLADLPDSCFERKAIEPKPEKGKIFYPSTAEEIAKAMYRTYKDLFSQRQFCTSDFDNDCMKWAIAFLESVYGRFSDDEWGEFRIGKMLIWNGNLEAAKKKIIPVARRKQTEFWVWVLMGDLFPDKKKGCVARALLCKADEKYTVNLKKEAARLGLDALPNEKLQSLSQDAESLLLEGLVPVKGVLIANYRNKEGKFRVRFKCADASEPSPISPSAIRLPKGLPDGAPVWLYRDDADRDKIIAVKLRADAEPWDVLPSDTVTFYRISKSGKYLFVSESHEYSADKSTLNSMDEPKVGDVFDIRYVVRMKDEIEIRTICRAIRQNDKPSRVYWYSGGIRFLHGGGAAFVEDVYLHSVLADKLRVQGCAEGTPVGGLAIKLPPKQEVDRFGNKKTRSRREALTVEQLKGEALERYRYAREST